MDDGFIWSSGADFSPQAVWSASEFTDEPIQPRHEPPAAPTLDPHGPRAPDGDAPTPAAALPPPQ